jgi:hypothetical protein
LFCLMKAENKFVFFDFFKSLQQVCAPAHAGRTHSVAVIRGSMGYRRFSPAASLLPVDNESLRKPLLLLHSPLAASLKNFN